MILDHLHVLFSFTSPLIDSFFRFPLFGAFRKPPPKKKQVLDENWQRNQFPKLNIYFFYSDTGSL